MRIACALAATLTFVANSVPTVAAGSRGITVKEAVEATEIVPNLRWTRTPSTDEAIFTYSSDGRLAAYVTRKGNVRERTLEYTLWLVEKGGSPQAIYRVSSRRNTQAIEDARWVQGTRSVAFLAEQGDGTKQVVRYDADLKRAEVLSHHPGQVVSFDVNSAGLIFIGVDKVASTADQFAPGDAIFIAGKALFDVAFPSYFGEDTDFPRYRTSAYVIRPDGSEKRIASWGGEPRVDFYGIWMSPDGRHAVALRTAPSVPSEWERFSSRDPLYPVYRIKRTTPGQRVDPIAALQQFTLIDVAAGSQQPMLNAPIGPAVRHDDAVQALWIDNRTVILSSTMLPVDRAGGADDLAHPFTVAFDLVSRNAAPILALSYDTQIASLSAASTPGAIVVRRRTQSGEAASPLLVKRERRRWVVSETKRHNAESWITLNVAYDKPARIVNEAGTTLQDLNPTFAPERLGHFSIMQVPGPDGENIKAALLLPPQYVPGRRYPLVIQTHGFYEREFLLTGPTTSAMAAQPLANEGFAVLQIDNHGRDTLGPDEGPDHTAVFRNAIKILSDRGIVDSAAVGLVGWSRTGYHANHAAVFAPDLFKAVVSADWTPKDYIGYMLSYAPPANPTAAEDNKTFGGPPYGPTLENWAAASPTFNAWRLQTPLLLQSYGDASLVASFGLYATARYAGRPVDLLYVPFGAHTLVRPTERFASEEATVDWFRFWLMGAEDPNPAKAEQYVRWRTIKEQNRAR